MKVGFIKLALLSTTKNNNADISHPEQTRVPEKLSDFPNLFIHTGNWASPACF